jgi:hypothetical protein|tara:strand:+ start:1760 stop:2101 length:342 start_codon:yes stop_codon:yes gene_type:complete
MDYLLSNYLEILCILFFILAIFFGYFCIKFALIIVSIQDSIEECLNVIDEKYAKITGILEIPLFFDSPEIKRMLSELKDVKLSILYIANRLSPKDLRFKEEKEDNDKSDRKKG